MRGFPLVNLLLALGALVLLLVPLLSLSREDEVNVQRQIPGASQEVGQRSTLVRVKLAHPATEASLWLGETNAHTWKLAPPSTEFEVQLPLPWTEDAMEFQIRLTWPTGTPQSVAEVTVEPEGFTSKTQNVWGTEHTEEVLAFSWKQNL